MNTNQTQQGFTLIELMIVIAIIGILSAVALPAYSDYTNRAKMAEVLLAASTCRTEVTEMIQSGSATQDKLKAASCETSDPTKYVTSVTVSGAGVISVAVPSSIVAGTVTMSPKKSTDGTGNTVNINGSERIASWVCNSTTTALDKLLPSSCRV
tara:strand:- start:815 stop:1276 length:462 start_codon:yes stop_codon:yes gene_type:complete